MPSRKFEIETKLDNNEQTLNSILTINHAREEDSGKYRCIYDNIQEQINIRVVNDSEYFYRYRIFPSYTYFNLSRSIKITNIKTTCLRYRIRQ